MGIDVATQAKRTARQIGVPVLICVICVLFVLPCAADSGIRSPVSLASYNVENLFDLKKDLTEYPGYVPGGGAGWNPEMLNIKLSHIGRVINDLDADILALQEVESRRALNLLNQRLETPYPHKTIADKNPTTVKCALMSRFPIKSATEIPVPGKSARNILKAEIEVAGHPLIVFVNHWKSKSGPESKRLPYARALAGEIEKLGEDADFVIVGDLNANYNEFKTFRNSSDLNDTHGITGINHILNTVRKDRLVTERILHNQPQNNGIYLYNLWLEVDAERRWSVRFFRQKNSPDHIIVSPGLYDDKGISYVDNSFDKYDPGYLFKSGRIRRWQRADKGRGRHLGEGFSDHLPVFAWFAPRPFTYRPDAPYPEKTVPAAALYESKTGRVNYHLRQCAVIYQHQKFTIIKQRDGRSILIYGAGEELERGRMYHLTVKYLKRYYGMLEITRLSDVQPIGEAEELTVFFIEPGDRSLDAPELVNEVVGEIRGIYRDGWLYYGNNRKISLYAKNRDLLPENGARIMLRNIRIGFHHHPELVLERANQLKLVERN